MINVHMKDMENVLRRAIAEFAVMPKDVRIAMRRASQRALQAVKVEALRIGRAAYENPPPSSQSFTRAVVSALGGDELGGTLYMSGWRGISLYRFKPLPNLPGKRPPEGVSVKIRRDGQRKVYGRPECSKPFIMKKKQGGFGIFVRKGKKEFRMLYGPSPIVAVKREDNRERLIQKAEDVFERRLNHELHAIVNGLVGRRR